MSPSATVPPTALLGRSLLQSSPTVAHAGGLYVTLADGRRILDASAGAAVACIGHSDPRVTDAVIAQMNKFSYVHSMAFVHEPGEELARMILDSTGGAMGKAYFVGSGSEAVEAALKLARQYFFEKGEKQRIRFIARKGSYHGTTLGALGVGGHTLRRSIYEPILSSHASFVSACNSYRSLPGESNEALVARLAAELDSEFQRVGPDTVCAFIAEPVVGAALGCVPSVPGYFRAIQDVCRKHGALLILDEIMCGMGRTGTLHAWQQEGVVPDIQTIGKGLCGGYIPLAGLLIQQRVIDVLHGGTGSFLHGQTFQGHPLACAAALTVQKIIKQERLVENVAELAQPLEQKLKEMLASHPYVGDIRGRGFFWGIEFVKDKVTRKPFPPQERVAVGVHELGLKMGISLYSGGGTYDGVAGDHVLLAPPLNLTMEELELMVDLTKDVVVAYFERKGLT